MAQTPELESLQKQLKREIQSHQILVAKLKLYPQDSNLKQMLKDQQIKITELNDKQKKVVDMLRSELAAKKENSGDETGGGDPSQEGSLQSAPILSSALGAPGVTEKAQLKPLALFGPTGNARPSGGGGGRHRSNHHHHHGSHHHHHHHHHHGHHHSLPLGPPGRMSIMTNKPATPIKIPDYKKSRPLPYQYMDQPQLSRPKNPSPQPSNKVTGHKVAGPPKRGSPTEVEEMPIKVPSPGARSPDCEIVIFEGKKSRGALGEVPVSHKIEFMASLGLITPLLLEEIQSKRMERKRRSTANPQFSNYGTWEQDLKKRPMGTYLSALTQNDRMRKRGRPSRSTGSRPCSPADLDAIHANGGNLLLLEEHDGHDDVCAICKTNGQLLMCDTCSLVYHLECLEPPLAAIPAGLWICPLCQARENEMQQQPWTGTLAIVHSYIAHKTQREEEKKKLQKRQAELRQEKDSLESKVVQLTEKTTSEVEAKSRLLSKQQDVQNNIEKIKTFLQIFQQVQS